MKDIEKKDHIMPEGYASELEGCLWMCIIIAIAAVIGGVWLFTR